MSTSLYWSLPPAEREDHDTSLKYEIGRYFDEKFNGSPDSIPKSIGNEVIPFLKGLIIAFGKLDNRSNDAKEMIDAIEKYGKILLSLY